MIGYFSIKPGRNVLACLTSLGLFCGVQQESAITVSQPVLVSDPPETRSPVSLEAINDPHTGKAAFSFDGRDAPPVIRANPGEDIRLTYTNAMSTHSQEHCVDGPCMNMTNLHFHRLHVSPNSPQDDVITMMAMPGESLRYVVNIPLDQAPGLYWYHTHPHGQSYQQDLDSMSGAIVIDGMEEYVPEVQHMQERVLVLRDRVLEDNDPASPKLRRTVEIPAQGCGASTDLPKRILTVNDALRPQIAIAPGERRFWRIVNASPDLYADLQVDTEQLEIVALDGMPLSFHDPKLTRDSRMGRGNARRESPVRWRRIVGNLKVLGKAKLWLMSGVKRLSERICRSERLGAPIALRTHVLCRYGAELPKEISQ
jgi:hypothetical protein